MTTATFVTTDGVAHEVACEPEVPLLVAAEKAGVALRCGCRHGACGACRSHLVSGQVRLGAHLDQALSGQDEAAGDILLCCGFPVTDVRIQLAYDEATRAAIGA
jgi:CDP-4-dehydro-6-deoxyglucose reductase